MSMESCAICLDYLCYSTVNCSDAVVIEVRVMMSTHWVWFGLCDTVAPTEGLSVKKTNCCSLRSHANMWFRTTRGPEPLQNPTWHAQNERLYWKPMRSCPRLSQMRRQTLWWQNTYINGYKSGQGQRPPPRFQHHGEQTAPTPRGS